MADVNPCVKECPERSPTCHCTCSRYKAYKEGLPSRAFAKEEVREYMRSSIGKSLKRYRYRREKQGRTPY